MLIHFFKNWRSLLLYNENNISEKNNASYPNRPFKQIETYLLRRYARKLTLVIWTGRFSKNIRKRMLKTRGVRQDEELKWTFVYVLCQFMMVLIIHIKSAIAWTRIWETFTPACNHAKKESQRMARVGLWGGKCDKPRFAALVVSAGTSHASNGWHYIWFPILLCAARSSWNNHLSARNCQC